MSDRTLLTRQIAGARAEIDTLVYQLYGLSAEEIRIVGGTNPSSVGVQYS